MKLKKKEILLSGLMALGLNLFAQETDTTSLGYRIGYQVGSWLPFAIIVILALMVIIKSSRPGRK